MARCLYDAGMLLISARQRFWDATDFSDADDIREVVLDNPDPAADTPVGEAALLDRVAGQRVLLLVHGYNNTEDDVSLAYARIEDAVARHLRGQYDLVMGYTWPGGGIHLSYPIARARANTTGPRLAPWLVKLARRAAALDVMSHSLGARVVLKALGSAPRSPARPLRHLYLLASAVDNESIEKGEEFYDATRRAQRVLVVHSKADRTLAFWFRLGDAILPWQWFDFLDVALGSSGPENPASIIAHTPHVVVVNGKHQRLDHGDYKDHPALFGCLRRFLEGKGEGQFWTL